MKRATFIFLLLFPFSIFGQQGDTLKPASVVKSATVYFAGAEVLHEIALKANKGRYVLEISDLPSSLDPDRIQAAAIDGVEILAVTSAMYQRLSAKAEKDKKRLEAEIQNLEDASARLQNKSKAFATEEKLLLENMNLQRKGDGAVIAEIREAADFYRERLNDIYEKKMNLNLGIRNVQDSLRVVLQRLNKVMSEGAIPKSVVHITIACTKQINGKMELKYFATAAGWEPTYDFRVEEVSQPLELVYNAKVFQSTGEDWKAVKLTFSSANPSVSGTAPELDPWYINRRETKVQTNNAEGFGSIMGTLTDAETGEALPFVNLVVKEGNRTVMGAATDFDGGYTMKPVPVGKYDLEVNYVGYESTVQKGLQVNESQITFVDIAMQSGIMLQQFEIVEYSQPLIKLDGGPTGGVMKRNMSGRNSESRAHNVGKVNVRGARDTEEFYYIDGVKVRGSAAAPIDIITEMVSAMQLSSTSISFTIDQEFTIPSTGKDQLIAIKKESVQADYVYLATPKSDKDVFLVARLPKWSELQLLSGTSSIYYQGTYTGDAYINSEQTTDTLEVSLGRDASITSQRIADKEINDKKFFGSNIKQTVGWELTVRNNKPIPVMVEIRDQYPLSELKSIEVEQLGHGDARLDEDSGKLTWTRRLEAGSTEKVKFSYGLKYPQGRVGY